MNPPYKTALNYLSQNQSGIPGYKRIYSENGFFLYKKISISKLDFFEWIDPSDIKNIKPETDIIKPRRTPVLFREKDGDIYMKWDNSRSQKNKPEHLISHGSGLTREMKFVIRPNAAHITWVHNFGDQGDIFYRKINLETKHSGSITRLTASQENSQSLQMTVDSSGGIHIVWVEENSESSIIYYKYIDDLWGPGCITEKVSEGYSPSLQTINGSIFLTIHDKNQTKTAKIKNYWQLTPKKGDRGELINGDRGYFIKGAKTTPTKLAP